jgi:hypothetical protein
MDFSKYVLPMPPTKEMFVSIHFGDHKNKPGAVLLSENVTVKETLNRSSSVDISVVIARASNQFASLISKFTRQPVYALFDENGYIKAEVDFVQQKDRVIARFKADALKELEVEHLNGSQLLIDFAWKEHEYHGQFSDAFDMMKKMTSSLKPLLTEKTMVDDNKEPALERILIQTQISPHCITRDNGLKLNSIVSAAIKDNKEIILDFKGIKNFAAPFFSGSIGLLFGDFPESKIKEIVKFENLCSVGENLVERTMINAKEYFSDPEYGRIVEQVLNEVEAAHG